MKKIVMLKESQLKQLISENIRKFLIEDDNDNDMSKNIFELLNNSLWYDYPSGKFRFIDEDDARHYGNSFYLVKDWLEDAYNPEKEMYYKNIINDWKNETRRKTEEKYTNFELPEKTLNLIKQCEKVFSCEINILDQVYLYDRGGHPYAVGAGVSVNHTTSSYANGPSHDYSQEVFSFLKHNGFQEANSTGDNGMDSSTNFRDTSWTDEFIYTPTMKQLY